MKSVAAFAAVMLGLSLLVNVWLYQIITRGEGIVAEEQARRAEAVEAVETLLQRLRDRRTHICST